jgi:hypothetical protein
MSNGFAGTGAVPAELHDLGTDHRNVDSFIGVGQVWSSSDSGVELYNDEIDGHLCLSNEHAVRLAGLLLKASQPANIPGNGYEAWVTAARAVIEDAFDPKQGWEYDDARPAAQQAG